MAQPTTCANDGYRVARLHLRNELGHCARETEAGAEQRGGDLAANAVGDVGDEVGMGKHVLLEGAVRIPAGVCLGSAVVDLALTAAHARFARAPQPLDADACAQQTRRHIRANLHDAAHALVPRYLRVLARDLEIHAVRVADARALELDEDLAGRGPGDGNVMADLEHA